MTGATINPWTVALLAVLLPPVEGAPPWVPDPSHRQALKDTAHLLDLWDRAGTWGPDHDYDLAWCQRTWRALHDAPPSADARRFPPARVAIQKIQFNAAYRDVLEHRQFAELHRYDELTAARQESLWLHTVWERVATATRDGPDFAIRRKALRDLRDLIGPAAYYAGTLPPWVPTNRFRPID